MHHLILGYGYCGYYLAQKLIQEHQQVTTVSRHLNNEMTISGINHIIHDLNYPLNWNEPNTIIYYLIPPPSEGTEDTILKKIIHHNTFTAKKVIYFGTSGVYGNHQGAWISEKAPCLIDNARQMRRLDAEHQWSTYCDNHHVDLNILRIGGIYGPGRLPLNCAKAQTPLLEKEKAPFINHIYVKDLANIAYQLGQIVTPFPLYNVADGDPQPMGTLQQNIAQELNVPLAPYESWQQYWDKASPMKREFMTNSKRLETLRLQKTLGSSLVFTSLKTAIKHCLKK